MMMEMVRGKQTEIASKVNPRVDKTFVNVAIDFVEDLNTGHWIDPVLSKWLHLQSHDM